MKNIINGIITTVFGGIIAGISFFDTHEIGLGICGCVIFVAGVYLLVSEIIRIKNADKS